jgi:hypothetical protein
MTYFNFKRHFLLLGGAIVVLGCLSLLPLYDNALFASSVNGALHALTLVASLYASATLLRKLVFVVIAAALSILTLYIGIVSLVALSILPDAQRLPAVIAIGSLSGAITYASLVRIFWVPGIRSRVILGLAAVCAGATLIGYVLKLRFDWPGMWWLAAIWWLAFSLCLRFFSIPSPPKTAL